jgi:phosphatidylglycerol:prolipoprotein diacylglycerol transferase
MVPIQLIESLVSVLIVFALVITAHLNRVPSGRLLPLFFLSYGSYRFVADFYRTVSVRPRIGRWSEAQVVSIVVVVLSAATLALANFVQIF